MRIDAFVGKFLILVIPGILGLELYKKIAVRRLANKGLESLRDIPSIIIIALVSSGIYDVCAKLLSRALNRDISMTFQKLLNTEMFEAIELFILIIIAVLFALLFAFIENRKIIYRIARRIKITNHYGDDDVWTYMNKSPDLSWLFVRDHTTDLVYYGLIEQYSDPGEIRELLLSDVSVYTNDTGEHLYDVNKLYISRNANEITIEVPEFGVQTEQRESGVENGKKRNNNKTLEGRK